MAIPQSPAVRSQAVFPPSRIAVSLAFLANGIVLGSWTPEIPMQAARLRLTESTLGLLILGFGLGAVFAMPLVGAAIARLGSRRPTLALQALLTLALPAIVLAPNLWLAAPAVFFFGMTLGGMDVAMNANAVAVERDMGRAIMSSCHGFWSIGGFAGAAAGGALIEHAGPLAHTLLLALTVLVLLAPVARLTLDDRDGHDAPAAGEGSDAKGVKALLAAFRRERAAVLTAVAVGVFALLAMVPEGAAVDWSAVYLRQDLGADVAVSGLAFAAFSATMALFRFAGDIIRDRLGAVTTVRISTGFAIAGLLVVGSAAGIPMAVAGFVLLGIGLSNVVPIAFSAAGNVPGLRPAIGLSIVTTLGYSGILLAPSAIGFAADHFGFPTVFLALSAFLVVVFLISGLMVLAERDAPGQEALLAAD